MNLRKAGERIADADNVIQQLVREKILRLSESEKDLKTKRGLLASVLFRPNRRQSDSVYRAMDPDRPMRDSVDDATIVASRLLQLGLITGAGKLTVDGVRALSAMASAEQQEPEVLTSGVVI